MQRGFTNRLAKLGQGTQDWQYFGQIISGISLKLIVRSVFESLGGSVCIGLTSQ